MKETTKLINITQLIDNYHEKSLYLSTIHIANSMVSVILITEELTIFECENFN